MAALIVPWAMASQVVERRFGWRKVMSIPTGALTKQEQAHLVGILRSRGTMFADQPVT